MRRIFSAIGLLVAGSLFVASPGQAQGSGSSPAQAGKAPLSAYGEMPSIEEASISPSGKHVAMLATVNGKRRIIILDSDLKPLTNIGAQDVKVRDLEWAGDEALVMIASQTEKLGVDFLNDKAEFFTATVIPIENAPPRVVFAGRRDVINAIAGDFGIRKVNDKWQGYFGGIVLRAIGLSHNTRFEFDDGRANLFAVDIATNRADLVARPGDKRWSRDWLVGADGQIAATLDVDINTGEWSLDGPHEQNIVRGRDAEGSAWLIGVTADGKEIVYGVRDSSTGDSTWYAIGMNGGTPREFMDDIDVGHLFKDPTTGRIIGYRKDGYEGTAHFFDSARQAAVTKIEKAFAGQNLRIESFTPDLSKVIVQTTGSKDSGTWYLVDVVNLGAKALGYERLAIGPDQVGPVSVVPYTARDGLEMDGILTLPPGKGAAKGLPLVVMPHGGPHAFDAPGFDWWAQAYASRGYAVFQPNFRGSTNRDDAFREAGSGEWGGKMQTDITDGVAALVAKGIVDPKRACIVGASYGGFAALAGVTVEQGRYKCAVAVAPVSDLRALWYEDASGFSRTTQAYYKKELGAEKFWNERSPLRNAARADAPVLLIHGRDDTRVPLTHTTRMADALKDAGKTVEVIKLPGEDHWLSRSATRQQMLDAAVAFVEKYNPAD